MKKIISAYQAGNTLLVLFALLVVFHITIIAGILPYDMVWGGQIDKENILPLELIAIVFTISFMMVVLIKLRYLRNGMKGKVANILLWAMVLYFVFNTYANFTGQTIAEQWIFGPLAIVMGILTARLAIS
ncbi:hypothetical protein [Roseimarinus sediminis]|uniref:hypothetical protein n=1 Tax=Roseimarinus sediminis TaxID=1610899 RepID=UPI003D1DE60A